MPALRFLVIFSSWWSKVKAFLFSSSRPDRQRLKLSKMFRNGWKTRKQLVELLDAVWLLVPIKSTAFCLIAIVCNRRYSIVWFDNRDCFAALID